MPIVTILLIVAIAGLIVKLAGVGSRLNVGVALLALGLAFLVLLKTTGLFDSLLHL